MKSPPRIGSGLIEGSIAVTDLRFDRENPRFIDFDAAGDDEIISELYRTADVDELLQSILSAGFVNFEPMIVLAGDNTVLEGNRRLAALRILSDEELRERLNIRLPAIEA